MTLSLHESSPHMHTLVSRPPHRPPFVVRASHAPLAPRHRTIGCGCSEPYMVQHLHGLVRRERRRRDRRGRSAQRPGGSWGRATPAVSAADITAAGMPPPIAAKRPCSRATCPQWPLHAGLGRRRPRSAAVPRRIGRRTTRGPIAAVGSRHSAIISACWASFLLVLESNGSAQLAGKVGAPSTRV